VVEPLAGAGPADSLYELGQSFRAGDLDAMALNAAVSGIDLLGAMANPIDALATSTIGWMIEHLSFLRIPLDATAGNPQAVLATVKQWNDVSVALSEIADEQRDALRTQIPTYLYGGSTSTPEFQAAMNYREAQIRGASMTCAEIAAETASAGAIVGAVRGVIRDMIADFAWRVLRWVVPKLALATVTFGASVLPILSEVLASGAQLLRKIIKKLDELVGHVELIGQNLTKLARRFDSLLKPHVPKGKSFADIAAGLGPLALKVPLDSAKEYAKVDVTATTDRSDANRSQQLHEHLGSEEYQDEERGRDRQRGTVAPGETKDWWTKKGQL
jgi:hypothetical protein